jgi:colicin import membrane protein/protein TonB
MSALLQSPLLVRRERLWPVALASLAVHVAVAGAVVLRHDAPPRIDLGQKPIAAKLVRLGEKRPEHYLPRKEPAAAEPAPAPQAVPAAALPQPVTAAAAAPARTKPALAPARPAPAQTRAGTGDALASVLSRVRREKALASEPVYGDPNGDPLGDASEGAEGDLYLALVERALRQSYVLPSTISERDRVSLRATVVLYVDDDGRVLRHAFEQPSGNAAFDAALERAIRAARLPPPPAELRERYRKEGLGVVYRP